MSDTTRNPRTEKPPRRNWAATTRTDQALAVLAEQLDYWAPEAPERKGSTRPQVAPEGAP